MEWKSIKGYEGLYLIGSDGTVVSEERVVRAPQAHTRTIESQVMKKYIKGIWEYVKLSKNGRVREHGIKRLMFEHFPTEKEMIPADVAVWMQQVMLDVSALRVTIDSGEGSSSIDQAVRNGMLKDLRSLTDKVKKLGYEPSGN